MTKQQTKLVTNAVVTASAAIPAVSHAQPQVVVITEPTHVAFAAAASLIRAGWIISPDFAPEIYASTSQATITLVRGNPDARAVAIAEAAEAYAIATTARDFDKEVDKAAARMIEQAAKEAKQAEIAAVVAANKAEIARLTAEMNAQ